ncbi:MAG: hypothetical protein JWN31_1138 [Frankiales bacterium]|nr:hypothetical protein [Frankiales bacterium]
MLVGGGVLLALLMASRRADAARRDPTKNVPPFLGFLDGLKGDDNRDDPPL